MPVVGFVAGSAVTISTTGKRAVGADGPFTWPIVYK